MACFLDCAVSTFEAFCRPAGWLGVAISLVFDPVDCYGKHLFEHWNAAAILSEELKDQYLLNEAKLSIFSERVNLVAFINGQSETCFSTPCISFLKSPRGLQNLFDSGRYQSGSAEIFTWARYIVLIRQARSRTLVQKWTWRI
jgi:hypothetical protein